jgi:hypothetical protein
MNHGCHGARLEMQGISSISQMVETGLVVSGVLPTSMMSISSSMISSRATSAARLGFDWLSLTMTSSVKVVAARLDAPRERLENAVDDELVDLGKGGERAGLRRHVAHAHDTRLGVDGRGIKPAAASVAAVVPRNWRRFCLNFVMSLSSLARYAGVFVIWWSQVSPGLSPLQAARIRASIGSRSIGRGFQ